MEEEIQELVARLSARLKGVAAANAVVARPVSVGDRHVLTLCELGLSFGGAGGDGDGSTDGGPGGSGRAGLAVGGAKASPVALVVIEDGRPRLIKVGR
ncbi:MAG TPA: spore germination protein GerW family protein [Polyangiaceae bacterium LLY-WYZ-14_1]|jgi:uncharacterized spore protein YtfJ|nr:spore germination protein GerW family protein [Polyangiaceae bacterium LLY-WYZ-14_1]